MYNALHMMFWISKQCSIATNRSAADVLYFGSMMAPLLQSAAAGFSIKLREKSSISPRRLRL